MRVAGYVVLYGLTPRRVIAGWFLGVLAVWCVLALVRVFRAIGCQGLSRVDFFVTHDENRVVFNEINTLPGFTSISMYPKLFEASGVPYSQLIDELLRLAVEAFR